MRVPAILRAFLAVLLIVPTLYADGPERLRIHRNASTWVLAWHGKSYRCAVGRNGVAGEGEKREGDGRTPGGTFVLRGLYYRPDRVSRAILPTRLAPIPITPADGWCDDPDDLQYNRLVRLPYAASHEKLWREKDGLYDLILIIGYNDDPVVPGRGSAIFMHVARPDYSPTAGCVALSRKDLMEILTTLMPETPIEIRAE